MKNWLKLTILPLLGSWLIRLLGKALRIESRGQEDLDHLYRSGRSVIIAFWHGRQLMMPLAYRGKEAHILISQHRDGELIRRIVARFGFHAIRGSTTRGGTVALRRMIRIGKAGKDIVVTPDGPQGPRHIVQMGVIHLAKVTGMPIVPLGFGCSKKKSSKAGIGSWCPCRPRAASS
jgi:lysophospholipid acyltransferase (LPLAT)-like uncharacterized protein